MTRMLLRCGVIAGPLFVGASFVQAAMRPGFDLTRQPLSLLLLGDHGWIQLINFEASGILAVVYALGVRRALYPGRAGTWGPLLIGAWGAGLIIAGIFGPDPSMGYPPGAPEGNPTVMTTHSMIHGIGFFVSLLSLVAACFVFAPRFASLGKRGWATYCVASGIAMPAFMVLSGVMMSGGRGSLPLIGLATVMAAWIALVASRLLTERAV
jgi:hypothetical protein